MVVVNLVNGDMVGHTNVHDACLKAVKSVDDCVGQITVKVLEKKGTVMIFADHGNIEDQSGDFGTSHTLNPVPLILVSSRKDMMNVKLRKGGLSDIAPTALDILGIEKPPEMTGESLIVR